METEQARQELSQAVEADRLAPPGRRHQAARALLARYGVQALRLNAGAGVTLPELIHTAAAAPATPERRAFVILLVQALGIAGLVRPDGSRRRELDRDICRLAETAIASVLLRAGYPFHAAIYDKLRFLERLHATMDEHLRPFEPTFPPWLHGVEGR